MKKNTRHTKKNNLFWLKYRERVRCDLLRWLIFGLCSMLTKKGGAQWHEQQQVCSPGYLATGKTTVT